MQVSSGGSSGIYLSLSGISLAVAQMVSRGVVASVGRNGSVQAAMMATISLSYSESMETNAGNANADARMVFRIIVKITSASIAICQNIANGARAAIRDS